MKQQLGKTIQQMRKVQGSTQEQMAETASQAATEVMDPMQFLSTSAICLKPTRS